MSIQYSTCTQEYRGTRMQHGNICNGQDVRRVAWGSSILNDTLFKWKETHWLSQALNPNVCLKAGKSRIWFFTKHFCRTGALDLPSVTPLRHFWTFIYENTSTEVPVSHRTNTHISPLILLSNHFLRNSDDVRSQKNSIKLIQWAKFVDLQMDSSGSAAYLIEK